jgi:hypothetical protein
MLPLLVKGKVSQIRNNLSKLILNIKRLNKRRRRRRRRRRKRRKSSFFRGQGLCIKVSIAIQADYTC